jgi:hypothetical protein
MAHTGTVNQLTDSPTRTPVTHCEARAIQHARYLPYAGEAQHPTPPMRNARGRQFAHHTPPRGSLPVRPSAPLAPTAGIETPMKINEQQPEPPATLLKIIRKCICPSAYALIIDLPAALQVMRTRVSRRPLLPVQQPLAHKPLRRPHARAQRPLRNHRPIRGRVLPVLWRAPPLRPRPDKFHSRPRPRTQFRAWAPARKRRR